MQTRRAWCAIAQNSVRPYRKLIQVRSVIIAPLVCGPTIWRKQGNQTVNRIIWIVGVVVIVLFILGFLGLR